MSEWDGQDRGLPFPAIGAVALDGDTIVIACGSGPHGWYGYDDDMAKKIADGIYAKLAEKRA